MSESNRRRVVRNTYPRHANSAEAGDEVTLVPRRDGGYNLRRDSDGRTVYSSPNRSQDSPMPPMLGVIAAVKSRGYVLEIVAAHSESDTNKTTGGES